MDTYRILKKVAALVDLLEYEKNVRLATAMDKRFVEDWIICQAYAILASVTGQNVNLKVVGYESLLEFVARSVGVKKPG